MKKKPNHFLVLNTGQESATLTIAVVSVTVGDTKRGLRSFKKSCENRGLWCAALHPLAAKILMAHLTIANEFVFEKVQGAGAAADAIAREERP